MMNSIRPALAGSTTIGDRRSNEKAAVQLDDLSKQIIEALQEDGRRSYATIAQAVGLSEAAVRHRVQRLVDTKVIEIVAVTDPMQLGFARQAMVGIHCAGDATTLGEQLKKIPEVSYVVLTAGMFDVVIEVVCADDSELLDLLNMVKALPGVTATDTLVYLKLVKQHYGWGTR